MAEYIERDLALRVIKQKQKELCPFGTYGKKYVDGYEREKFDEWQEIIDEIESVPRRGHGRSAARSLGVSDFYG